MIVKIASKAINFITYNIMPKSVKNGQESKGKKKSSKRAKWIQERTRNAVEYYSHAKKEDLQDAKIKYLQKLGIKDLFAKSVEAGTEKSAPINDSFEEVPIVYALRKSTLSKECSYEEESLSSLSQPEARQEPAVVKQDSQSSLAEEDQYELKEMHNAALQVQKIIDNFLDFHCVHRSKRSVPKQELINFLKTTKYCLNSEKYINVLLAYNRHLYNFEDNRITCRTISSEERDNRFEDTKNRMRRKRVQSALLMFN